MYKLQNVSKVYRKGNQVIQAVRDLTMEIGDGEWLSIQGKTGHGKTTLLQLLGGLDVPSSGQIEFSGGNPATRQVRARDLGFIFQTFNLIPTLTAQENVEAALIPLRISEAQRRARSVSALDSVTLGDRARHLPSELSGGQQQRVAIARALVKDPKVLLADEPTGNLDEDTRDEIIALIERLWRERGLTLILVSHDSMVAHRAQRVAVMNKGRLSVRQDTRSSRPGYPGLAVQIRPEERLVSGTQVDQARRPVAHPRHVGGWLREGARRAGGHR